MTHFPLTIFAFLLPYVQLSLSKQQRLRVINNCWVVKLSYDSLVCLENRIVRCFIELRNLFHFYHIVLFIILRYILVWRRLPRLILIIHLHIVIVRLSLFNGIFIIFLHYLLIFSAWQYFILSLLAFPNSPYHTPQSIDSIHSVAFSTPSIPSLKHCISHRKTHKVPCDRYAYAKEGRKVGKGMSSVADSLGIEEESTCPMMVDRAIWVSLRISMENHRLFQSVRLCAPTHILLPQLVPSTIKYNV